MRDQRAGCIIVTSGKYCADLVARRDEDRWLSAQYAPAPLRAKLIARYALHEEIRKIPAAVSEPPLGEIRLQWWREALDEIACGEAPRAHPVIAFAASCAAVDAEFGPCVHAAIDARARLLYGEAFATCDDLFNWLDEAEGYLARARSAEAAFDARAMAVLARAEGAFTLERYLPLLAAPLKSAAAEAASDAIAAGRRRLKTAPAEIAGPFLHLSLRAPHERKPPSAFAPVAKRLRLFAAMATGAY